MTFDGDVYSGKNNVKLEMSLDGTAGSLSYHDEDFATIGSFKDEGSAGVSCQIWALYGQGTIFTAAQGDEYFSGELGRWGMADDHISVVLTQPEDLWLPNIYINAANGLNHLPIPGTRIKTKNGIIELGNTNARNT